MRALFATLIVVTACGPASGIDSTSVLALKASDARGARCYSNEAQPGGCAVGERCSGDGYCSPIPAPSCENFDKATTSPADWYPAANKGPVIFSVEQTDTDPSWAGDEPRVPAAFSITVHAYWTKGRFPKSGDTFPFGLLWYVHEDGFVEDAAVLFRRDTGYVVASDRHSASLTLNMMRMPARGGMVGLAFSDGNEACTGPIEPRPPAQ